MKNKFIYSLVIATVNRSVELEKFLKSILLQNFDLNKLEVIIVNQNKTSLIDKLLIKYKKLFPHFVVYKINLIGVSNARNIGLKHARGDILCFPDDDCEYFPDTLNVVKNIFDSDDQIEFLLGTITDKTGSKDLIRKWPKKNKKINSFNFFYLYTMITFFTKKKILFDERFGGGGSYCAYEDADVILNHLNLGFKGTFYPQVNIYHPELNISSMNSDKVFNYGVGFGAFCRKNISINLLIIYFVTIIYHFMLLPIDLIFSPNDKYIKRKNAFISRLYGWMKFSKNE